MCLTVGRQSRDHRPLSRDPSKSFLIATLFQNCRVSNCLKRPKNVVWQSADGRVTVAWPFSDFFQNFPKSLETSRRPTVAWPQPLSRDRSATFFKIFPNRLKRLKNVVWQSADGRVTSTTVAWPFSDFFQNFPKSLETSKKRCLTVSRRSRDLNTVAWPFSDFFQNFPKSLETSRDGRVTSDHCRVTVQRLFSKFSATLFFKILSNCLKRPKTLFDSRPTVARDPRPLSRDRSVTFSDFFQNSLPKLFETYPKKRKTLFDSRPTDHCRVTSDHCRVMVAFSDYCLADVYLVLINSFRRTGQHSA